MLNNLVKKANGKGCSYLLIMGNCNYKWIIQENWNTPTLSRNSEELIFIENLQETCLDWHATKPLEPQRDKRHHYHI